MQFACCLFSLSDGGSFTYNVSRCDIAIDDISYEEKRYYRLDLGRVERALKRHEFATRLTRKTHYGKDIVPAVEITDMTVRLFFQQLPARSYFCKPIQNAPNALYSGQPQSPCPYVPLTYHICGYVYLTRDCLCIEFFRCNRFSCCSHVSGSCGAFEKFLAENVNYYIRFVVVKGKPDVSHMCRYDSKRWWLSFVGTIEKAKLVHTKPDVNEFNKKIRWIKRTVAPTLRIIHEVVPMDQYLMFVNENSIDRMTPNHDQIIQAFIEAKADDENVLGLKRYENYTNDYITFIAELERNRSKNEIKYLLHDCCNQSEIDAIANGIDECESDEILKFCDYKQIGLFADELRSQNVMFHDNLKNWSTYHAQ